MSDAVRDITPADPARSAARLAWVDYAKALAIILVVFGHASRSLQRTDGLTWSEGLQLADRLIYTFHIPLFFVLAGYTASLVSGRRVGQQARALFWGIAVPYLVWTYVWVGLKLAFPGSVNEPAHWSDLVSGLWLPVEHMWFLQHLMIARVVWLIAERAQAAAPGGFAGSAIIVALFAAASWIATFESEPQGWSAILSSIGFVGVGLIWIPVLFSRVERLALIRLAFVAAGAWLLIASQMGTDDLSPISFVAALLAILAVMVAVRLMPAPSSRTIRTIAFLGEASLAIYVSHSIVIAALRAVLQKAGLLDETLVLTLGTLFGVAVPALIYWSTLEMSARTGWPVTKLAGFGTATRSHYIALSPAAGGSTSAASAKADFLKRDRSHV